MPELDELRGWAILLVVFYHNAGSFGVTNWLHTEVGVDIFLLISGFTLARSSIDLPWREFIRRRLCRIFPAYWIALGIFLALNIHFFGAHRSWLNVGFHVLGIHAFGPGRYFSDINDSFWFISLILTLYVVFLLIRRQLSDFSFVTAVCLWLTSIACWIYLQAQHDGGLSHFAVRIPGFFIGLMVGRFTLPGEVRVSFTPLLATGLLAMTYLGWVHGIIAFYALAGPAMVVAFLVVRRSLLRHPDGRLLLSAFKVLGIYSYEIFLFHQPLMRDYTRLFWMRCFNIIEPSSRQLFVSMVVAFLLTLGISVVVHQATNRIFSSRRTSPLLVPA